MKKFYIEESGIYKIRTVILGESEDEALEELYNNLPDFIDIERDDREIEEMEMGVKWNLKNQLIISLKIV